MKHSQNRLYIIFVVLFCFILMSLVTSCTTKEEIPITSSSDEAKRLFLDGRDEFELLELGNSAQYFDQSIAKDTNFALAHLYRYRCGIGHIKINLKHLEIAVELADEVSEGEKYLILYQKAQLDGDNAKRKEYLDKLLELFPSDKRVQHRAGQYYNLVEKDTLTALKYYNQAKKIDKNYAPIYNAIGYLNIDLGNYEEAEKAFKKQIRLIPERPNPYDSYGEFLLKIGKYDGSIKQYKLAFEKDNSYTSAIKGVGDNYILKDDYVKAREYYQEWYDIAAEIWQKYSALNQIAGTYVLEGKIKEALNIFKKYRNLANENNDVGRLIGSYNQEGFILSETGNTAEGLKRKQKALEIASQADSPEPIKTYRIISAKFQECEALLLNKNTEEALVKIEELSKITKERKLPNDTSWINWLNGLVAANNGNFKQAVELYSKSWAESPMIKYYIADAYRKMGDQEKADEIFKGFEKLNEFSMQFALVRYLIKNIDNK